MPLGVHVSIAGGLHRAVERAVELGCSCFQIFGRNPRSWVYKPLSAADAALFRVVREGSGPWPVVVHTDYLINLSSADDAIYEKSIDMFNKELDIAEAIGADYLVTHLGSPGEMGSEFAVRRVIDALGETAKSGLGKKATVLLENTSGAGSGFGADFRDIGRIIRGAADRGFETGMCLDTCHAFAAGYSFADAREVEAFLERIDADAGVENIRVVHLNDSKGELGSHLDRHEHIGKGKIGLEAFRRLLNHRRLKGLPLVLETPKKAEGDDPMNLAIVRGLLD